LASPATYWHARRAVGQRHRHGLPQ